MCLCLGEQLLGAVLPNERDPAIGQGLELLDREVFHGCQDLDLTGFAASRIEPLVDALEVEPHILDAQPLDQLNHATAACRPVSAPSRR